MLAGIPDTTSFIALGLLSVLSRWVAPLPQPYPRGLESARFRFQKFPVKLVELRLGGQSGEK